MDAVVKTEKVVENLNRAFHELFARDPHVYLIGEDIMDPYGGAFKVSKGLFSKYPDRVLTTPISEGALVGVAGGLALCGEKPIVEIMFGDFIALGFDQILNFCTKSVAMYGRKQDINVLIRCPVGGNRSYGPTHSQSLQKHFVGIPYLHLYELSPFHDNVKLLDKLVNLSHPSILFEDKVLYTQRMYLNGALNDLFGFEVVDKEGNFVRVFMTDAPDSNQCLLIAPGGMTSRCLAAAQALFIDFEIETCMIVPSRLYPFEPEPILEYVAAAEHVFVIEEGMAGGTWGSEVAHVLYDQLWGRLKDKIHLLHSRPSIIPSSAHLERQVIVQTDDIVTAIHKEVLHA